MRPNDFVHLHVHSHFSLLDGNCRPGDLMDRVQEAGQDAIALTDHGNLFGAIHFYKAARKRGINPILGIEAYVTPDSRFKKKRSNTGRGRSGANHVTLLARNNKGFDNLIKLASTAYIDGFYYKPRIDHEAMREWSEGLICLSGCLAGEVNQAVLGSDIDKAERLAHSYREIFGKENYFLEIMNHGMQEQRTSTQGLVEVARRVGSPLVATNDVHYVNQEDWKAQDVAICIGTGKLETDEHRFRMATRELYFKTADEMAALFKDQPEAIASTREIADRCKIDLTFGNRFLPSFKTGTSETPEAFFRRICSEGIKSSYPEVTEEITNRLNYELDVITSMGFVDYFLITWDFMKYAREMNIPVGPGRGSAAGSIVAYALRITEVDPLRYDLLFERFLNSERISMPDIDIDFCKDRRGEVIEYVEKKYGRDHVAQIITFGTLKARAAIRDVGRVLDVPLGEVDRIAKKIPNGPKDTLKGAMDSDLEVQKLYQENEQNKRLFDIALKLEGAPRHASIHAAGVVISDRPISERVPLYRSGDDVTTQWPCEQLEEVGLLKLDFLGLRNLTIIKEALDNIESRTGERPDMSKLPLDDAKTYETLSRGEAMGVFQLESDGMRSLLTRLKPDRFDDLVAVLALYRPGPLGSGMHETYVNRKHGREEITYPHRSLEPILEETLGVIIYQEQVMRIASTLSGFSLNDADALRKAMSKKKEEDLEKFKGRFVEGAAANGVEEQVATEIWDVIVYFAGYGFNKSHSVAYAMITYQTAWLKTNYQKEYMAALLSCEMSSIDKTVEYTEECRERGIEVVPPDVNCSMARFTVDGEKICFALAAIKGVGEGAIEPLVKARTEGEPFTSIFDFCERVDVQKLNKSAVEALINAGALDSLEGNRAQLLDVLDDALAIGSAAARDRNSGQASLFGLEELVPEDSEGVPALLPNIPELPEAEKLQREKDVLGFYLTGHPLNGVRELIERFSTAEIGKLEKFKDRAQVVIGGIINKVRPVVIRRGPQAGQKMAFIVFEDFSGTIEAGIGCDLYQQLADDLREDLICFLKATVDHSRDETSLRTTALILPDDAPKQLTRCLTLRVGSAEQLDLVLPAVRRLLKEHSGPAPVFFDLDSPTFGTVLVQAGGTYNVDPSGPLIAELEKVLGTDYVKMN